MNIIRLYGRVLALLGSDSRVAWALALANLALASAQFAEPVLLGRIIDTLTGAQTRGEPPSWSQLGVLLAAWAGFGLFTIACGTMIALFADRLAHRRRHVVLTGYFEHVLQLPLTYHGNTHSGRLMKVMLQGTDALWGLWVGFFRDQNAQRAVLPPARQPPGQPQKQLVAIQPGPPFGQARKAPRPSHCSARIHTRRKTSWARS